MFSLFFSFVFTYSPRPDLKKNTFLILPRTIFSWNTNAKDTRKTLVFLHWPASMAKVRDEVNFWCVFLLFLFFFHFVFVFDGCSHISCSAVNRTPISDHRSAILENHCSVFGYRSAISENHCSVFGYRSPIRPKWHRSPIITDSPIQRSYRSLSLFLSRPAPSAFIGRSVHRMNGKESDDLDLAALSWCSYMKAKKNTHNDSNRQGGFFLHFPSFVQTF